MRGKGNLSGPFYSRSGITPACAGKRVRQHRRAGGKRDHPRVCGEKSFSKSPASSRRGSPPRVRGKGGIGIYSTFTHGITPACAGKSCSGCCSCSCAGDHPRVCGEKSKEVAEYASKAGSPPRVRGKEHRQRQTVWKDGITPACAGKSWSTTYYTMPVRDHPRVCGEKGPETCKKACGVGSPPRVRGKVSAGATLPRLGGITPACAGKSWSTTYYTMPVRDHPRVCGEKRSAARAVQAAAGSPPRVRGKVPEERGALHRVGITPACAGKSSLACCPWRLHRDHPRVCGEKTKKIP